MKKKYQDYINLLPKYWQITGKCEEECKKMKEKFPELEMIRGFFFCVHWGKREHWWLELEGEIIDPTRTQYPTPIGLETYEPWTEGTKEPTGKCPNCGNYSYDKNTCCSNKCSNEYLGYLNNL